MRANWKRPADFPDNLSLMQRCVADHFATDFTPWMIETAKLHERLMLELGDEFDPSPLNENEQTIVSLLQAAAALAGHLSLAEVAIEKKKNDGRADLWLICGQRQYWIEFKRTSYLPGHEAFGLRGCMKEAEKQVAESNYEPNHFGVACLVASQREMMRGIEGLNEDYDKFAEECSLSFQIVSPDGLRNYIYFRIL
jgi:hypothetical protein